jgi:hypothetical protein
VRFFIRKALFAITLTFDTALWLLAVVAYLAHCSIPLASSGFFRWGCSSLRKRSRAE